MRKPLIRTAVAALCGGLALLPGCGSTEPQPASREPETLERLPALPPHWTRVVSRSGGFSAGLPPRWIARMVGTRTIIRSPDRTVALSITADRTNDALELAAGRYALGIVRSIPKLTAIRVGEAHSLRGHYAGVLATGEARTTAGLRVGLSAVVVKREAVAVIAVLVVDSDSTAPGLRGPAAGIVESLRTRPVALAG